jgi:hypothetical protein
VTPLAPDTAERRLLLALLGCRAEALSRTELMSLFRQVNWQIFLANTSQDLYPYLAFRLEPFIECIDARRELELLFEARRNTAVHNLRLHHELGKAIEILSEAGIPALALKGVVLAYTAYPDPSLRPMSDVDLLVPTGTREKAVQVLQALGFEYPDSVFAIHRDHCLRLSPEQEFAPALRLRASNVLFEVHTQLECSQPVLPAPAREFWSRSVSVDLNGLRVQTLCPEDFLFHLCLHQSRWHRFEKGLLPLVDLKLLIDSHPDWDWAGIAARSLRWGCATWMYLTLERARDLVSAPVPDTLFQALPQRVDLASLRGLVEEQIWSAKCNGSSPPLIPTLLSEHSWRARARMILSRMRLVGREELGHAPSPVGLSQRARLFCRRFLVTLKTRIPGYFRAWRSGRLKVGVVLRTARLLRQSNTMFQLVEHESRASHDKGRIESM